MEIGIRNLAVLGLGVGLAAFWIANGQAEGEAAFPMPTDKAYVAECGSCHAAYAPGLLPARSWLKMMAELDVHFGEDASLDDGLRQVVTRQLTELAADSRQANALMRRIAGAIPAGEAPQRISTSPYFKYMHDEVPDYIWKRSKIGSRANCGACHGKANEGRYSEREVRIPK